MRNSRLVLFLAAGPLAAAVVIGGGLAWLAGDLRVVGLVGLAAAIVGAGLTGYYQSRVSH
jgi:hypothetical protein